MVAPTPLASHCASPSLTPLSYSYAAPSHTPLSTSCVAASHTPLSSSWIAPRDTHSIPNSFSALRRRTSAVLHRSPLDRREEGEGKGFVLRSCTGDGNCVFRVFADQLYGNQEFYPIIRRYVVQMLNLYKDFFRDFVTGSFEAYLEAVAQDRAWGDDVELTAVSLLYRRPIQVYNSNFSLRKTLHEESLASDWQKQPFRILFCGDHYTSIHRRGDPFPLLPSARYPAEPALFREHALQRGSPVSPLGRPNLSSPETSTVASLAPRQSSFSPVSSLALSPESRTAAVDSETEEDDLSSERTSEGTEDLSEQENSERQSSSQQEETVQFYGASSRAASSAARLYGAGVAVRESSDSRYTYVSPSRALTPSSPVRPIACSPLHHRTEIASAPRAPSTTRPPQSASSNYFSSVRVPVPLQQLCPSNPYHASPYCFPLAPFRPAPFPQYPPSPFLPCRPSAFHPVSLHPAPFPPPHLLGPPAVPIFVPPCHPLALHRPQYPHYPGEPSTGRLQTFGV